MSRPSYGYLFFDFPSDHEIDGALTTECQALKAVLANRNLGSRLKIHRCSTVEAFKDLGLGQYQGIRFVHISGHGSRQGLGFIGGEARWSEVARKLKQCLRPLDGAGKRVLTLSCCNSEHGIKTMQERLSGYFTGGYYFYKEEIGFSESMTVWSMFYFKKGLSKPHEKIVDAINTFLEDEVIGFCLFPQKKRK